MFRTLCMVCFQRKLLAIYLHHDNSILSNVFCSQILCAESVVAYLSNNFVTWGWDLTAEANKARCDSSVWYHTASVHGTQGSSFFVNVKKCHVVHIFTFMGTQPRRGCQITVHPKQSFACQTQMLSIFM